MLTKITLIILILLSSFGCSHNTVSNTKPDAFVFEDDLASTLGRIENQCKSITVKDIIPISSALAKINQRQINCAGFYYAGKLRNIELVFFDDELDLVWIIFPNFENDKMVSQMTLAYGQPSMVIDYGVIYLQVNAVVRNKPSEVLFASDRQVKEMLKNLAKQK